MSNEHQKKQFNKGVPSADFEYLFDADPDDATSERILAETFSNYHDHLNPGFIAFKRSAKLDSHGVEWRGEGCYMYDIHGHRFLDCLGGYGVFTLGHRHPHVIKRVQQTMERIGMYSQELLNPLQAVLAREISLRAPGDLQYVYYHCGGGESNDAALKLARLSTGRFKHVSFSNAFHGKTMGALTATNRPRIQRPFEPLIPGFSVARYNEIEDVERLVQDDTASVIVEAVQGEGGIIPGHKEFLQAIRRRCDETGALMHVDEVQSGWGRSGRLFCIEHFDVNPDIVTLGKALGGGMFPHSALIANKKAFGRMAENPWWLTNTFAGSQLGCAAALATLEVYEQENLVAQCRDKGAWLKDKLSEMVQRYPGHVKEVRGLGLWIGFELHTPELGTRMADELFKRDILVAQTINNPTTLRFQPPFIIDQEQMDTIIGAVESSIGVLEKNPVGM